jgi:hypothetical protein
MNFSLILWVIFALLDPDGSTTLPFCSILVVATDRFLYSILCTLFAGEAAVRRQAALPGAHGHEHRAQDDGRIEAMTQYNG